LCGMVGAVSGRGGTAGRAVGARLWD
jgi:hypothetical protein